MQQATTRSVNAIEAIRRTIREIGDISSAIAAAVTEQGAATQEIARSVDVETRHLQDVVRRAHDHRGTSFVEILQNCNVFNDGAFADVPEKATKADHTLVLEHGKPLVFGKDRDRGIRLRNFQPEVVRLGDGVTEADLLVHDEANPALAYLIARLGPPNFPTPIGVFTAVERALPPKEIHDVASQLRRYAGVVDWAILYPPHFGVDAERIHANELSLIEVAAAWTG